MLRKVSAQVLIDEALLLDAERDMLRAVVSAIIAARNAPGTLRQLADRIAVGDIEGAIEAAARAGVLNIANEWVAVYSQGGKSAAAQASAAIGIAIDFDQTNDFAIDAMRRNKLDLVQGWRDDIRNAARETMRDSIERGLNPRDSAREFRDSIGLTPRQQRAVNNYRRLLERAAQGDMEALRRELRDRRFDPTVRRAARTGEPLTRAQIDRMVERYRERYLKYRAEVIARTETLRALNQGTTEAMRQAIERGDIPADGMDKEWVASRDNRVRPSHVAANGQRRPFTEPYSVGGAALMMPGDPDGPARETIQCFVRGTGLHSAGLRAIVSRRYCGEVVEIFGADGVNLTVTPNHPIYTDSGWMSASLIKKGDNLIYCDTGDFSNGSHPKEAHRHAAVEELYRLAERAGGEDGTVRTRVNFHGDIADGDIDYVAMPRHLLDAMESAHAQCFGDFVLEDADIAIGASRVIGNMHALGMGDAIAAYRFMRRIGERLAFFARQTLHPQLVGFGGGAALEAELFETLDYGGTAYAERSRHRQNGLASLISDLNGRTNGSAMFIPRGVVGVRTRHYEGPVYNAESRNNILVANGIVVSNCRCRQAFHLKRDRIGLGLAA